ncbi:hypothetical protein BDV98DRAFT_653621 [Pterulicium gracile]|uniref:Uncharacterized protein n=1 Tax=Pterulicium gracile TaxID=1884261 RepID=A0A5C3QVS7_9AGAR|nr:hypothetical protein BDV98DRAFT_653621 [Pterula gracilis]
MRGQKALSSVPLLPLDCAVTRHVFSPALAVVTIGMADCLHKFSVIHSFEPFTLSVVLLAQRNPDATEPSSTRMILKIYDTRYLRDRKETPNMYLTHRPWIADAERTAAETRAAFARGDFTEDPYDNGDALYEDWPPSDNPPAQARRSALWEEHFYRYMLETYHHERRAYQALHDLQGTLIPRFLAEGFFVPPPEDGRSWEPPAIILEYIPSITLGNISSDLLTPALYLPFVEKVDKLHTYGLAHGDLHADNVLLSPADNPTRTLIVDWGNAPFREDIEDPTSDKDWKFQYRMSGDSLRLRHALREKGFDLPEKSFDE